MTSLQLKDEIYEELTSILDYWQTNTIDRKNGGFIGRIGNGHAVYPDADKGSVLHARILWTFSAAYGYLKDEKYLDVAKLAFKYLESRFVDHEFGGVFWSVSSTGEPVETKKQIYAQAFAIYGLSEYYRVSKNEAAKALMLSIYELVEKHSHDRMDGGYIEAFSRAWQVTDDLALSPHDLHASKTMNTHLHVLEAYASLFTVWPDATLKRNIRELLNLFLEKIIDRNTHHLHLFFDRSWKLLPGVFSFGHDIEAAWLLQEAAEALDDRNLLARIKTNGVFLADAAAEGLDKDGGMWYEYDPRSRATVREKHWWPQAEAMIGFYVIYRNTHLQPYLQKAVESWGFIRSRLRDRLHGEWFWGIDANGATMAGMDKVGPWKCPYHNSRACLELLKRL